MLATNKISKIGIGTSTHEEVILDWFKEGILESTTISQLPNNFDKLYPEN